jgi:hypothetical protein
MDVFSEYTPIGSDLSLQRFIDSSNRPNASGPQGCAAAIHCEHPQVISIESTEIGTIYLA